ncbi:MAG TPA: trimeric intracellular cation channel family protein, partial [Chitinophagaceae bacterium]|nr:trimeric intracellular cation channel family protein [Chitinophagaceae bacterium]
MRHELLELIDVLGVIAFSIAGVFAAMEKKLDPFGIFIIAFVTAMGGGTIRDILIGDLPVNWIRSANHSLVIFISTVVAIVFNKVIRNLQKTLFVFDSLGLGLFTVAGIEKGLNFHLEPGMCIALGTITGCFGGVIRDIFLNTIPIIFHKEIYAIACIIGGSVYFLLLETNLSNYAVVIISILVVFLVRVLAVRYHLSLPSIYQRAEPGPEN